MKLDQEQLGELTQRLIDWIKESMKESGGEKAVIGISGGKDSSVVAALCVEALGNENVVGVLMPEGVQEDIDFAEKLCDFLKIKHTTVNIESMVSTFLKSFKKIDKDIVNEVSDQTKLNIAPRVRMTLLYAISQSIENSRVINTSNISEDWVGYATVYGDTAGAFSPLGTLTSDEVVQVGAQLGLPVDLIIKDPSDGLTGKTDEDVFGFSYDQLNRYIREGICDDEGVKRRIDKMHRYSRHKFLTIPMFPSHLPIVIDDIADVYKKYEKEEENI